MCRSSPVVQIVTCCADRHLLSRSLSVVQVAELLLENSADVHVLVQVVPLYRYPSPDVILDIARDRFLVISISC